MTQKFVLKPIAWTDSKNNPVAPSYEATTPYGTIVVRMAAPNVIELHNKESRLHWKGQTLSFSATINYYPTSGEWRKYAYNLYRDDGGKRAQAIFEGLHDLCTYVCENAKALFGEPAEKHINLRKLYLEWQQAAATEAAARKLLGAYIQMNLGIAHPDIYQEVFGKLVEEEKES
jgi:hypothetical protein